MQPRQELEKEIMHHSSRYLNEFSERAAADEELTNALNNMHHKDNLEITGFPYSAIIKAAGNSTKNIKAKMVLKIIEKVSHVVKENADKRRKERYEANRKIVISRIQFHINASEPRRFDTVAECLGWELFLSRATNTFLLPKDRSALDMQKAEARLRTTVIKQADLHEGLAILREQQQQNNYTINQFSLNQNELIRLQNKFIDWQRGAGQKEIKLTAEKKLIESKLMKLGVQSNQKLDQLLTDNKEIQNQLGLVTDYMIDLAEKKKQAEITDGLMNAAGFVGALGQFVESQALCDLSVIAQSSIQFFSCVSALQGPFTLASLNPLAGACGAILAFASVLKKHKNKDSESNKLFAAMQYLASLLHTVRKEMHERFDRIEDILIEIHKKIIDGFNGVSKDQKKILTLLDTIYSEIVGGKIEIREIMSSLSEQIKSIYQMQHIQGRREEIKKIEGSVNLAIGVHSVSNDEFKKLYSEFTTSLLDPSNPVINGDSRLSPSLAVAKFEADEGNAFMTHFHINSLLDVAPFEAKKIPQLMNPTIWSWQVMGLMELLKRIYPTEEKDVNFISKAELKKIEEIAQLGEKSIAFTKSLRAQELIEQWIDRYHQAGLDLQKELKHFIREEELIISQKQNERYAELLEYPELRDKKMSREKAKSVFNVFQKQDIPVNFIGGSSWFVGLVTGDHNRAGRFYECAFQANEQNAQKPISDYKISRQKATASTKEKYISAIKQRFEDSNHGQLGQFHYFSPCEIKPHSHYNFAFPGHSESRNLILPLPYYYQTPIPPTLQLAEWMNIGHIEFNYNIAESSFILETRYILDGESHLISTLISPYTTGIYTTPNSAQESLWWYWAGGNYAKENACTGLVHVRGPEVTGDNTWNHYIHFPLTKDHLGKSNEIKKESGTLLNAEEKIIINDQSKFALSILQRIKEEQKKYKQLLFNKIKQVIESNNQSALGKAFVEYSYSFYMLKTILSFAFGENNLEEYEAFHPIIHPTGLNSRHEILATLETLAEKDKSIIDLISERMELIAGLSIAIEEIMTVKLRDTYQMSILEYLNELIAWYQKHAVDENQLHSKIQYEKMLEEQNKMYGDGLFLLQQALLTCHPDAQKELKQALERQCVLHGKRLPTQFFPMLTSAESKVTPTKSTESKIHISELEAKIEIFDESPKTNPSEKKSSLIEYSQEKLRNTHEFILDEKRRQQTGWSCFDVAVELPRKQLVDYALSKKDDLNYRRLLAPEIINAAFIAVAMMNKQDEEKIEAVNKEKELEKLFQSHDDAVIREDKEKKSEVKAQIENMTSLGSKKKILQDLERFSLPKSMHTVELQGLVNDYNEVYEQIKTPVANCNSLLGFPERCRLSFDQLREYFNNAENRRDHCPAWECFKSANEIFQPYEQALYNYCEQENIYETYINEYYAKQQWVAFQLSTTGDRSTSMVDIAADRLQKQIIIYREEKGNHREIYRTKTESDEPIHVQFNGLHFVRMYPNPEYDKIMKQTLVSHFTLFKSDRVNFELLPKNNNANIIKKEEDILDCIMGYIR